jgi:hypothetical protein
MDPLKRYVELETRRQLFSRTARGLGTAALASLLGSPPARAASTAHASSPPLPGLPHFAPRAKRAIYLFMSGAPSQIDMFDYKPKLAGLYDQDLPESVRMGQRLTTMTSSQARLPIAPSMWKFKQHGRSGAWLSELLPHTGSMVDQIAIVKTVHTEAINHDPAITYICTGNQLPGRASLGSWLSYGLGSENDNLPAFIVLNSTWTGRADDQPIFSRLWGSGFLPSRHQGVMLRSQGDPVLFLSNPPGVSPESRRQMLEQLNRLNERLYARIGDPETQARIAQYEMAFRMQSSVPELVDMAGESQATLEMYGPDSRKPGTFAYNCLLARRMMERGVRFVQVFHRGWDHHLALPKDLPNQCRDIDQGATALINDLAQRGLLDETLVVWGGEFGRTVYCQGKLAPHDYGRDHHPKCFTMWLAGGGIRPGIVHGETDDFSYNAVRDPVHIHELNATILHCLGIDHARLTYKFQGLDQRLTGVEHVGPVTGLLA